MLIADLLYARFPQASEGDLTRLRAHLVRSETLSQIARREGFVGRVRVGPGEKKSSGWRRDSILADALEAVLAAIYLDAGLEAVRKSIQQLYEPLLRDIPDLEALKDAKTRLQEWLQARAWDRPEYELLRVDGPPHKQLFSVQAEVRHADACWQSSAQGRSRRQAEQDAAAALLEQLQSEGKA